MKVICVLIFFCVNVNSYKILGLFPYMGRSHFDFFEPLMKALAEKGHEVTVISHFPQKTPIYNFKDVDIRSDHPSGEMVSLNDFTGARWQKYLTPGLLAYMGYHTCHDGLPHKNLHAFLEQKPKFDVIMAEFFNNECFMGVVYRIKAPLIGLSSCTVMPWHDSAFGYATNPSIVPNSFMPFTNQMTFLERVENTLLYVLHKTIHKLFIEIPGQWAAYEYLGNDIPRLSDVANNATLILVNNHFTYTLSRPVTPGYIEVAGMHITKPKKLAEVRNITSGFIH